MGVAWGEAIKYNHEMPDKKRLIAFFILISASVAWILFGAVVFAIDTSKMFDLSLGVGVGAILLLNAIIACRSRTVAGWLLILEGILPLAGAIAAGRADLLVSSLVCGPLILAGLFFVVD